MNVLDHIMRCHNRAYTRLLVAQLSIGRVHFDDGVPLRHESTRETRAIGTRALDAEGADASEGTRPDIEFAIALSAHRDAR
jgi:hypothetical protein